MMNIIYILYLLMCIPSLVFSSNHHASLFGPIHRNYGFASLIIYVVICVIASSMFDKKDWGRVEKIFIFIGTSYFIYGFMQFFDMDFYTNATQYNKIIAFAGNSNMCGNVFAILLPFFLKRGKLISMIPLIGVGLSGSRSAIIASFIILFFWYVKSLKARIMFPLIILSLIFIVRQFPNTNKFTQIFNYEKTYRGRIVVESLQLLNKRFWGLGNGVYREEFGKIKSKQLEADSPKVMFDHPHNMYLNHVLVYGYPATIMWFIILFMGLRARNRSVRYAILSYCIWGFGSFDTHATDILVWSNLVIGNRNA